MHARRKITAELTLKLNAMIENVVDLEFLLDASMMKVNSLGKKNNNLMVKWELPKNLQNTVAGILGPTWYKLRQSRVRRYLERIKKDTPINRDLVRACFQKRKEKEILIEVKKIKKMVEERSHLIKIFTVLSNLYTKSSIRKGERHE